MVFNSARMSMLINELVAVGSDNVKRRAIEDELRTYRSDPKLAFEGFSILVESFSSRPQDTHFLVHFIYLFEQCLVKSFYNDSIDKQFYVELTDKLFSFVAGYIHELSCNHELDRNSGYLIFPNGFEPKNSVKFVAFNSLVKMVSRVACLVFGLHNCSYFVNLIGLVQQNTGNMRQYVRSMLSLSWLCTSLEQFFPLVDSVTSDTMNCVNAAFNADDCMLLQQLINLLTGLIANCDYFSSNIFETLSCNNSSPNHIRTNSFNLSQENNADNANANTNVSSLSLSKQRMQSISAGNSRCASPSFLYQASTKFDAGDNPNNKIKLLKLILKCCLTLFERHKKSHYYINDTLINYIVKSSKCTTPNNTLMSIKALKAAMIACDILKELLTSGSTLPNFNEYFLLIHTAISDNMRFCASYSGNDTGRTDFFLHLFDLIASFMTVFTGQLSLAWLDQKSAVFSILPSLFELFVVDHFDPEYTVLLHNIIKDFFFFILDSVDKERSYYFYCKIELLLYNFFAGFVDKYLFSYKIAVFVAERYEHELSTRYPGDLSYYVDIFDSLYCSDEIEQEDGFYSSFFSLVHVCAELFPSIVINTVMNKGSRLITNMDEYLLNNSNDVDASRHYLHSLKMYFQMTASFVSVNLDNNTAGFNKYLNVKSQMDGYLSQFFEEVCVALEKLLYQNSNEPHYKQCIEKMLCSMDMYINWMADLKKTYQNNDLGWVKQAAGYSMKLAVACTINYRSLNGLSLMRKLARFLSKDELLSIEGIQKMCLDLSQGQLFEKHTETRFEFELVSSLVSIFLVSTDLYKSTDHIDALLSTYLQELQLFLQGKLPKESITAAFKILHVLAKLMYILPENPNQTRDNEVVNGICINVVEMLNGAEVTHIALKSRLITVFLIALMKNMRGVEKILAGVDCCYKCMNCLLSTTNINTKGVEDIEDAFLELLEQLVSSNHRAVGNFVPNIVYYLENKYFVALSASSKQGCLPHFSRGLVKVINKLLVAYHGKFAKGDDDAGQISIFVLVDRLITLYVMAQDDRLIKLVIDCIMQVNNVNGILKKDWFQKRISLQDVIDRTIQIVVYNWNVQHMEDELLLFLYEVVQHDKQLFFFNYMPYFLEKLDNYSISANNKLRLTKIIEEGGENVPNMTSYIFLGVMKKFTADLRLYQNL